jgi:hypothetical protein
LLDQVLTNCVAHTVETADFQAPYVKSVHPWRRRSFDDPNLDPHEAGIGRNGRSFPVTAHSS